jgi:hypothetical protein
MVENNNNYEEEKKDDNDGYMMSMTGSFYQAYMTCYGCSLNR